MTLDALTLGVVEPDTSSSEHPAAPLPRSTPISAAASPTPSAEPILQSKSHRRPAGGAATSALAHPLGDASPPNPSARPTGVEDQLTSASDGSAHTRTDTLIGYGAPNLSGQAIALTQPKHPVPGPGVGLMQRETSHCDAGAEPFDPAKSISVSNQMVRDRGGSTRSAEAQSSAEAAQLSAPASEATQPGTRVRGRRAGRSCNDTLASDAGATLSEPDTARGDGPWSTDALSTIAVAKPSRRAKRAAEPIRDLPGGGDGQTTSEDPSQAAVATIVDLWRQRQRLRSAVNGLGLTALAVCRRAHDGDKEAAQKAWALIQKGKGDPVLSMVVEPYREMMAVGDRSATALEKQLCKLVRPLPLWTWAKDVRGLGERSIAGLIGESAGNPGDYKSVSALWKRFGLAVIEGGRQRRVADAQAALLHGYAPQRRAFAYVLSTQLMRSQRAEDPYRQLYDRRKAYELEREIPKAHAHNRALRVMVKDLLKRAWVADRAGRGLHAEPPEPPS